MGLSETKNLEFETQKSERETLVVTCLLECKQELARGSWTAVYSDNQDEIARLDFGMIVAIFGFCNA